MRLTAGSTLPQILNVPRGALATGFSFNVQTHWKPAPAAISLWPQAEADYRSLPTINAIERASACWPASEPRSN